MNTAIEQLFSRGHFVTPNALRELGVLPAEPRGARPATGQRAVPAGHREQRCVAGASGAALAGGCG